MIGGILGAGWWWFNRGPKTEPFALPDRPSITDLPSSLKTNTCKTSNQITFSYPTSIPHGTTINTDAQGTGVGLKLL